MRVTMFADAIAFEATAGRRDAIHCNIYAISLLRRHVYLMILSRRCGVEYVAVHDADSA